MQVWVQENFRPLLLFVPAVARSPAPSWLPPLPPPHLAPCPRPLPHAGRRRLQSPPSITYALTVAAVAALSCPLLLFRLPTPPPNTSNSSMA